LLVVLFGFIVKYPLPLERDPRRLHYWNLAGVHVKAAYRSTCPTVCFDVVPFWSEYRRVWGADRSTYRVLGYEETYAYSGQGDRNIYVGSYAVDARHFFYGEELMRGVRPDEIELVDGFARDRERVYTHGGVVSAHDAATYERLTPVDPTERMGLVKSKAGISFDQSSSPLPLLDPETFRISATWLLPSGVPEERGLVDSCSYQRAEDKNFEYRFGRASRRPWAKKAGSGLDVRWIGCRYTVVGDAVYHDLDPVDGADPATFSLPACSEDPDDCTVNWYAKDRSRVYYRGVVLAGADAPSFVAFVSRKANANTMVYAFDARTVYCNGLPCLAWQDGGRSLADFEAAREEWLRSSARTP
jgi:hypothetical protein